MERRTDAYSAQGVLFLFLKEGLKRKGDMLGSWQPADMALVYVLYIKLLWKFLINFSVNLP
jgi:hypothetical protein